MRIDFICAVRLTAAIVIPLSLGCATTAPDQTVAEPVSAVQSFEGVVVSSDGVPLAGAQIVDTSRPAAGPGAATVERVLATAAADGRFEIDEVERTRINVRVRLEGYVDRTVSLHRGESASEIVLYPAASLEGVITDRDGNPVENVFVRYVHEEAGVRKDSRTSSTGAFSFSGVPAGEASIISSRSGFARDERRVTSGDPARIVLVRAAIVRGKVTGSTPEQQPFVIVHLGETLTGINAAEEYGAEVAPGDDLLAWAEVMQPGIARRTPALRVSLVEGEDAVIDLEFGEAPVLEGTVFVSGGDHEVRVVSLRSLDSAGPGTPQLSVAPLNGAFRVTGLPEGRYEISVTIPGYEPAVLERELTSSSPLEIEVDAESLKKSAPAIEGVVPPS